MITTKPRLRIFTPAEIPPASDASRCALGSLSHHRVVSKLYDPDVRIDVDYNAMKAGAGVIGPDVYPCDKLCYFPEGGVEIMGVGDTFLLRKGSAVWCPAGALGEVVMFREDAVSICAFAPAGGLPIAELPSEAIGSRFKAGAADPHSIFRLGGQIGPERMPGSTGGASVRRIFSAERDGATRIQLSQLCLPAVSNVALPAQAADEIFYLDEGRLSLTTANGRVVMEAGQMAYRPSGVSVAIAPTQASTLTYWTGPLP